MLARGFEDLEIWQLAKELVVIIYKLTDKYPSKELFGLISQLRNASISVAANIAEGAGRYHFKDKIKFFYNARGSLLEVQSHLLVSKDLGFVGDEDLKTALRKIKNLNVKLNNFIESLKQQ